ncbi:MAG TPA: hypothetical protein VEA59_00330 [Patescibacteria group bacterium]|nr:hypothetical protein [Patescibacteria group bacterium]
MKDFLPDNYEMPVTTGNYMKLEKGENTFRVLSSAVVGWEYWNVDDKPVRLKSKPEIMPADMRSDSNLKHFWAFVVWNYKAGKVQVLEVTQKTIQDSILALVEDEDWGSPKGYDIKINRIGDKLETVYTVSPKPHSPLKLEIESAYRNTPVDLNNLFTGDDPFDVRNSDGSASPKF